MTDERDEQIAPEKGDQDEEYEGKMFRVKRKTAVAFEILKARQGPRSGPRLIAEAIDLLLMKYGEQPVEKQPTPAATETKTAPAPKAEAPKAQAKAAPVARPKARA